MSYYDVTVVVEGAVESDLILETDSELAQLVRATDSAANADGLWTEIYVLWHDHEPMECACSQYVTDGHPQHKWNVPN